MPDKTYKIVDVVGVSDESIHQAEPEFQVTLRIGFRLEGGPV